MAEFSLFDSYEALGLAYEQDGLTYEGASTCAQDLVKLLPSRSSPELKQLALVLADELCKVKSLVSASNDVMDHTVTPKQFLPLLAQLLALRGFPYGVSTDEQRRFIEIALEVNRYKGSKYALEVILSTLYGLADARIVQTFANVFSTWRGLGNGYQGGETWTLGDAETQSLRQLGVPVDAFIIDDEHYPTFVLITFDAILDPSLQSLQERIEYARTIVPNFLPEVCTWDLRIDAYQALDTVPLPDISLEVYHDNLEAEDSYNTSMMMPLITGLTQLNYAYTIGAAVATLELELVDGGGAAVSTYLIADTHKVLG